MYKEEFLREFQKIKDIRGGDCYEEKWAQHIIANLHLLSLEAVEYMTTTQREHRWSKDVLEAVRVEVFERTVLRGVV